MKYVQRKINNNRLRAGLDLFESFWDKYELDVCVCVAYLNLR